MTTLKLLTPLFAGLLLASCNQRDKCAQIGCLPAGTSLTFSIVDSAGRDLVFGPAARYRADSMRLIWPEGSMQPVHPGDGQQAVMDSALHTGYFGNPPVLYLRLNAQDTDTLQLEYSQYEVECCGTMYSLRSLRYNTNAVMTNVAGLLRFQK